MNEQDTSQYHKSLMEMYELGVEHGRELQRQEEKRRTSVYIELLKADIHKLEGKLEQQQK